MAKELKGYRVNILAEPGQNYPQNIINEESFPAYQYYMVLVTDGHSGDSTTVMDDQPHLVLEKRIIFGKEYFSVLPKNVKGADLRKMFGGRFVWSSDSRFRNEVSELPLPIHERVESFGDGGGIHSHNSQAPMAQQEPTVDLTPVEFIPLYNKDEDEYIHAKLRYNDHFKHWDASIDGESEYFKNKSDAIASIENAGFKRKETFATGGDISSIDSDIEKLEKVVSSSMIPEHVKEKAKAKIAELKAQKESSKEKAAPNSGEKKMTGSKLRGYYYAALDKLNINSGSEIYQSEEIQRKLHAELSKKIPFMILEPKIFDNLEDNNAHSLNNYLGLRGMYGEAKRQKYVQDYKEQPNFYWNPSSLTSTASVGKPEDTPTPKEEKSNLMDMPELRKVIRFFENNIGKEVNLTITEFDGTSDVSGPIKKNGEYLYAIDWANFDLVPGKGLYGTESSYRNVHDNPTSLSFEYSGSKYQVQIASSKEDFSENKGVSVEIGSVKNTDFDGDEQGPNIKPVKVRMESIEAAQKMVNEFIANNDLGSGNWAYGDVFDSNMKKIGNISYNGAFHPIGETKGIEKPTSKPSTEKANIIGYAIVDPISGEIVASKATLDGLKEAHGQMEKDPDFADLDGIVYTIIKKNGKNIVGEKVDVDWIKSKKETTIKPEEKPTPSTGKKRLKDIADYVTRRNIEYVKFKAHGKEYTVASKNIIDGIYIKKDGHATEVRTQFKLGGGISANHVYISNRYIVEAVIKKDGKMVEYKGKDILDGIYVSKDFFGGDIPKMGAPKVTRTQFEEEEYEFGDGGNVSSNYKSINEVFRNRNKSVSVAEKVEIVKGLIDAGYTDADLTVIAKSGTAYTNKVDKKTEQVLAKFYKFYDGSLKGNMPFQTIYDIIDMNSRFKNNVISTFKSIHKFEKGGPIPVAFDFNRFTLSELIYGYSDVEVARLVKDKSKYIQPEEINKKYKNFEFKLTTNGDIVVRKGSENYYLEIPVQAADTKYALGDEFTIVLYTKDNKDGLKKIANRIIEKFKNGGYVRPSATMKTTGIYKFVTKDKEYILEVSMFERENELKDSLQIQNDLRGELGSILINNNAWRRLSKGDTVTAKASKSDVQGKLTRIDDLENVRKHLLSK